MADDSVSASAKGATFLILLQIGSRAITFALNQILLRFLSPELLGVGVQLELFIISVLYFSRESLRIAAQRRSDDGVQAAVNMSYLGLIAGAPFGAVFASMYLSNSYPNVPYLVTSLRICQVTAMVELFSEPAYVAVQHRMLYKTRAAAEATAVVVKTFATAGLVFWSRHRGLDLGVLPFAVGELSYSATLTLVYLWRTIPVAIKENFSLLPKSNPSTQYFLSFFEKSLLSLAASLYIQTGIKWLLTEGDKLLITALASLEDQGMYALSANYGGLIARMLFRPIEDSSRNLFADLCSNTTTPSSNPKPNPKENKAASLRLQKASTILHTLLHTYTLLSLPAFSLGPTAAPLLLHLIAGPRWITSGAGDVLATYCYCIPLLAVNGVSEAFVSATASTTELRRQSIWMGVFSAGFAAAAYVFLVVLEMGAKGLVWANCVNMGLRIVFNLSYAARFFRERGVGFELVGVLPGTAAVGLSAVVPFVLGRTRDWMPGNTLVWELIIVGAVGAVFGVALLVLERKFLMGVYGTYVAR